MWEDERWYDSLEVIMVMLFFSLYRVASGRRPASLSTNLFWDLFFLGGRYVSRKLPHMSVVHCPFLCVNLIKMRRRGSSWMKHGLWMDGWMLKRFWHLPKTLRKKTEKMQTHFFHSFIHSLIHSFIASDIHCCLLEMLLLLLFCVLLLPLLLLWFWWFMRSDVNWSDIDSIYIVTGGPYIHSE